jgi:hypothetical protein
MSSQGGGLTQDNRIGQKQKAITWNRLPSQGAVIITGFRGEGKSALGWWIAQTMSERTRKGVAAFGVPSPARSAFPKRGWGRGGLQFIDDFEGINKLKPSIIVVDEASFTASSREAMSDMNKAWTKLMAICRHKDHLLLFIHQHSRQLDIQLLMDADLLLMKRPTHLHYEAARDILKKWTGKALEAFAKVRGDTRKKVFVIDAHNDNATMLPSNMPQWWSSKVSKAFSAVEI